MLYAILCYNDENAFATATRDDEAAIMSKLGAITNKLAQEGKLGPVARLLPTSAAVTVRKDRQAPVVIDGPFAETKEALLGFYVVECEALDAALEITRELARATPSGSYEVRPIAHFMPGSLSSD